MKPPVIPTRPEEIVGQNIKLNGKHFKVEKKNRDGTYILAPRNKLKRWLWGTHVAFLRGNLRMVQSKTLKRNSRRREQQQQFGLFRRLRDNHGDWVVL